jgi:hypothetical protein
MGFRPPALVLYWIGLPSPAGAPQLDDIGNTGHSERERSDRHRGNHTDTAAGILPWFAAALVQNATFGGE